MRRRWMDQTIPNIFEAVSATVTNGARCLGLVNDVIGWDTRTEDRRGAFGEERILGYLNAVWQGIVSRGLGY